MKTSCFSIKLPHLFMALNATVNVYSVSHWCGTKLVKEVVV